MHQEHPEQSHKVTEQAGFCGKQKSICRVIRLFAYKDKLKDLSYRGDFITFKRYMILKALMLPNGTSI